MNPPPCGPLSLQRRGRVWRGTVTRDFMHRISENSHDEQTYAKLSLALEYALAALEGRDPE